MNKITWATLFILVFTSYVVKAQDFPVDTSFSLRADYQKQLKYYPDIKPVYPEVGDQIVQKKDLVYANYGDHNLHLDLYSPLKPISEKSPVVIFIHGGGWASGNKTMEAPMAIHLAKHGFITATIEYRLSPESIYPAGMYDIKTAIRWLRKNAATFRINPEQVAIYGTSSGGQMAALIGTTGQSELYVDTNLYPEYSSAVQAIIDIDGVLCFIHPESEEGGDKPGKPSAATRWFGGNSEQKKSLWDEASALYHTDANTPPILFINSQHPRFHAGRDDMIQKLDSLNNYSEIHTFPKTPHTFWLYKPWFNPTANYTINFLIKIFKNK